MKYIYFFSNLVAGITLALIGIGIATQDYTQTNDLVTALLLLLSIVIFGVGALLSSVIAIYTFKNTDKSVDDELLRDNNRLSNQLMIAEAEIASKTNIIQIITCERDALKDAIIKKDENIHDLTCDISILNDDIVEKDFIINQITNKIKHLERQLFS